MEPNLFFQTEGMKANGDTYESSMCITMPDERRAFAHALLDEFIDSFVRDPATAKLSFMACNIHKHTQQSEE